MGYCSDRSDHVVYWRNMEDFEALDKNTSKSDHCRQSLIGCLSRSLEDTMWIVEALAMRLQSEATALETIIVIFWQKISVPYALVIRIFLRLD